MSNAVDKEELLEWLDSWHDYCGEYCIKDDCVKGIEGCTQAHNQIVVLIKKFDEECVKSYKTGYKAGIVHEYSKNVASKEITEEWIEEKAGDLTRLASNLPKLKEPEYKIEFHKAKDFIRSLVEEVGGGGGSLRGEQS